MLVLRLQVAAQPRPPSAPGAPLHRLALLFVLLLLSVPLAACERRSGKGPSEPPAAEPAADARTTSIKERFGDAPFLSLIEAGRGLAMKDGSTVPLSASTCGSCHTDIYREWSGATHAAALKDLQYLAELSKEETPRWLCLNCHIPVAEQREYLVNGDQQLTSTPWTVGELKKVDNPGFHPPLQREAVTCATCHVRAGADGRGVVIGPRGSGRAPHVVKHDPNALRSVCLRCHSPGPIELTPTFFCWFETAEELKAGPSDKSCVDCHMPTTSRPVASGAPRVTTRRHTWEGGGVPKHFGGFKQRGARGYQPGVDVRAVFKLGNTPPVTGSDARVRVTLTNARGGHKVPTADPERFLLVDVRSYDDEGNVLARSSAKIGQRWDFGDVDQKRPARRLADNRLAHGEARELEFSLPHDTSARRFVVDVKHVRLTATNALYAAKAPVDDRIRHFRGDVDRTLPSMWEHYPLFGYIFQKELTLPALASQELDDAQLARLSADAATWPIERLRTELEPKTLIAAP